MKLIIFILNFHFTLLGIIPLVLSGPYDFKLHKNPIAFVFKVKSFWWIHMYRKKLRATTIGYIVLMGPRLLRNDLEHEIIHVKQSEQYPFIYPFIYFHEALTKGYRNNRFEDEAYTLSNSIYEGNNS